MPVIKMTGVLSEGNKQVSYKSPEVNDQSSALAFIFIPS